MQVNRKVGTKGDLHWKHFFHWYSKSLWSV